MAEGQQGFGKKRKTPTQSRSRATVGALVEAAAQVLERHGEEAVTTKSVAERAGVSIGTLYQYFDDRDALLLAVADRERERLAEQLQALMADAGPARSVEALRAFVRALVRSFVRRRGARRQFELMATMSFRARASDTTFTDIIAGNLRRSMPDAPAEIVEVRAFVLNYALQGVLRAAAVCRRPIIKQPAFEEALVQLVRALASEGAGR